MENYLLLKRTKEAEELSKRLGFEKALFLDSELALVKGSKAKELLEEVKNAKRKKLKTVYFAFGEEMLRFALEKSEVDIILGMEKIFAKDSLHYLKSGLDQILCKIALDKNKIIGFSVQEILDAKERSKLLARIRFNIHLCKKYKVKMLFGNFSREIYAMRSAKDLDAMLRVLG